MSFHFDATCCYVNNVFIEYDNLIEPNFPEIIQLDYCSIFPCTDSTFYDANNSISTGELTEVIPWLH